MSQATFDTFKAELLPPSRRSTEDAHAPPLSRLRSFQKLRTSINGESSEIYAFKSVGTAQGPLETQNFENLQSQMAQLEKSYELLGTAVAMMVGPSNVSTLEQQASDTTMRGGDPKGHFGGQATQAKDSHRHAAPTVGRIDTGMDGIPDQTESAFPDLVALQRLLSSGAVRRKMDYVEPNVFAVLVSDHATPAAPDLRGTIPLAPSQTESPTTTEFPVAVQH